MNAEELDAWFAEADDILDCWRGGSDAARATYVDGEPADACEDCFTGAGRCVCHVPPVTGEARAQAFVQAYRAVQDAAQRDAENTRRAAS